MGRDLVGHKMNEVGAQTCINSVKPHQSEFVFVFTFCLRCFTFWIGESLHVVLTGL